MIDLSIPVGVCLGIACVSVYNARRSRLSTNNLDGWIVWMAVAATANFGIFFCLGFTIAPRLSQ